MSKSQTAVIRIMKVLIGLLTAAALVLIFILVRRIYINAAADNVYNQVVTDKVYSDRRSENTAQSDFPLYDVKMNAEWTFRNGRSASEDAYVENHPVNCCDVYFTVTVTGLEEAVYTSPVLSPGSHLENIRFDKVLPAGVHNGVLTYHLLGSDGETEAGSVQMSLKITVLS